MLIRSLFTIVLLICPLLIRAQKPPLDHSVYDGWKSIASPSVTTDGKWVSYVINPQEGDGWLYLYNVTTGTLDSVNKASKPSFSPGSKYVAFQVAPSFSETRKAKKEKLKEDKMPKNSLGIRILSSPETETIPRVKSFAVAEDNSSWMAYLLEKKLELRDSISKSDTTVKVVKKKSGSPTKTPESKGTELVIYNPLIKKEFRYQDITEYSVARDGKSISFLQETPDTIKSNRISVILFDPGKESTSTLFEKNGFAQKLTSDKSGELIAFLFSSDTSQIRTYELWLSKNKGKAVRIIDTLSKSIPAGWSVSENGNITFSEDGTRLFFGTAYKPEKQPEDTLPDDEKFKLDIWSWNDDVLQPMQKKQLDQELKKSWLAVYHTDNGSHFQLADTLVPDIVRPRRGNNDFMLASSDLKYRKSLSWDDANYKDYYVVSLESGLRRLVIENSSSNVYLSPSGNYLLIYDYALKAWLSMPASGGEMKNLSSGIKFPLYNELNDVPAEPSPYGIAGWLDDKRHVLVYDRYDIWSLDLSGSEKPLNISNGFGRKNNLRLRYINLDPETEYINRKDLLFLAAFNYATKESGYYSLKQGISSDPEVRLFGKASFSASLTKAGKSDVMFFQKGSFAYSPEIYITDMSFRAPRKISVTNPQQKNYNWLTAELVEWTSFDNSTLQGILYKPEDFDPSKKYPMIIYFYERSSDGLYSYFAPAPTASIINRSFAASNGYLVFVPDIPYKIGYPGQSCYDAVVSGTYALADRLPFIDRSRIGLDGQSWGGYQIAWLVTQTDLFKCAYSGAPVSNMTSAYGGIRWESGASRMFQYEKTQSRIGGTLWEKPVHYIENSPIFFVPKINTPLLLMHNDADGAVPWYQGIEFFVALRRLNKPAWLLSYNDEAHNLVKRPNRKDLSVRKMQFFDHYLRDTPMPYWMKNGIKQTEKGRINGYNLVLN